MNQIKFINRLRAWPKKVLTTRVRLAFGMALTVLSLVFGSQLLGILPDHNQPIMAARKLQTETLAMTGSAIAESGMDVRSFRKTLQNTKERVDDVQSIGFRAPDGELTLSIGDHQNLWSEPADGKSNDQYMFVPVFRGHEKIAQLEICYTPLGGIASWFQSPSFRLGGFLFVCCCCSFYLLLKRTLQQLDPRGAVPKRVREAFDNMAEGLLIMDRQCRIMMANAKFGALVGLDADRIGGMSVSDFPWQIERELPWAVALRDQKVVTDKSLRISDFENELRTFSVSAAPVLGHGGSSRGVMVTFDDITELEDHKRELIKARNAADAANEAKSSFLARMSHEIRTPMNAIIGYTDVLRQGEVDANEQIRYLTTIQSNGDHLLELINDILDLSKIEAGQMTIERRNVQFIELCNQTIATLKGKADKKNLNLSFEIEGLVPDVIETDETRLRQILINTIGNAIKFTAEGGVKLIARMIKQGERPLMELDIADTGIGMPESSLKNIFQPFTQADISVTREFGGTGLGLAICKQLSESLGGGIRVRSEAGKGTVFTVSIDPGVPMRDANWITQASLDDGPVSATEVPKTNRRINGGHVLVVDDTKSNRDLARLMLDKIGMTSDEAENGKEALERLASRTYDIVLMDVNMPVMDGLTATRYIREAGLKTPIVAVTAMAMDSERAKCLNIGCDSFLIKPIRRESLLDVLVEFFEVVEEVVEPATATVDTDLLEPEPRSMVQNGVNAAATTQTETAGSSKMVVADTPIEASSRVASETLAIGESVKANDATRGEDDSIEDILSEILGESAFAVGSPMASSSTESLDLPKVVTTSLPLEPEFLLIVHEFVDRLRQRLPEFDEAIADGSTKQLSDLGHWLAGAASTVGLDALTAPSRELEYCDGSDPQMQIDLVAKIKLLSSRIQVPAIS
jgi:PAS domain S-box-containing protein